jgi:hypothetical protein
MSNIQDDLIEIKNTLFLYLQKPIEQIKHLPEWEWRRLIIAQIIVTMISGMLGGIVHLSFTSVIFGLFFMPLLTLLTVGISTLFFYYVFQVFTDKLIEFRKLFTAVFFANIPFFALQIIYSLFPPISLIGLAFTALLLIVAFVENFQMQRKFVSRLIISIYVLFLVITVLSYVQSQLALNRWRSGDGLDRVPEVRLGE